MADEKTYTHTDGKVYMLIPAEADGLCTGCSFYYSTGIDGCGVVWTDDAPKTCVGYIFKPQNN